MKRKPIPTEIRHQVYEKYNGHCAYCGCELQYEDMQVDHLDSVYRAEYEGREASNEIENLMPACRQCNFYKGTSTIDEFRRKILHLPVTAFIAFPVRLAAKYGIIQVREWDMKFYFEKQMEE